MFGLLAGADNCRTGGRPQALQRPMPPSPEFLQGTAPAKAGRRHPYIRECVARKFCYSISKRLPPEELGALRWADFHAVRADRNSFTEALNDCTFGEIEETFDMSPFCLPAWCCLVRCAPPAAVQEHLERPRGSIQEEAAKLRASLGRAPALNEVHRAMGCASGNG